MPRHAWDAVIETRGDRGFIRFVSPSARKVNFAWENENLPTVIKSYVHSLQDEGVPLFQLDAVSNLAKNALEKELKYQSSRRQSLTEAEKKNGLAVTIMGDEKIPYHLLKKVMTTCAQAEYRNISLAVNQIASTSPDLMVAGD